MLDGTGRRFGRGGWGTLVAAVAAIGLAGSASGAPSNVAIWSRAGTGIGGGNNLYTVGATVGTAGDFNCDGIADLVIGAPEAGFPEVWPHSGWLAIWYGNAALPPQPTAPPNWFISGNGFLPNTNSRVGKAVAAGDVNRDGCDDVLVVTDASAGAEMVRAFFGSVGGPSTTAGWRRFVQNFGNPASIASGDVNGDGTADIIVGIPEADFPTSSDDGAVLVWLGSQFLASNPDGANDPDWIAQIIAVGANLGASVATGDVNGDGRDDILAGAPGWTPGGNTQEGAAFLWLGSPILASLPDGTQASAAWSMRLGSPGARVGSSTAIAGDVDGDGFADMLVGAPGFDNAFVAGTGEGAVVVTRGGSPLPGSDVIHWSHPGQQADAKLGYAVASAGDVDGNGLADYLIGEPEFQVSPGRRGRAHLLLGRRTNAWGPNPASDVIYSEPNTGTTSFDSAQFGAAVGTAGDWNADGYSDVTVGAPRWIPSPGVGPGDGAAFVYPGRADTIAVEATYVQGGRQVGAQLGLGVSFAGDIDNDGFSDMVTGAPFYESGASQTDEGRFFVTYGGSCGPQCAPRFEDEIASNPPREGEQAGAQFGWNASAAGDVNGDGYADVIVSAPNFDPDLCFPVCGSPIPNAGIVRVYHGGPSGLSPTPAGTLDGFFEPNAQFGYSAASAGDVNGDGFGDVIIGAPFDLGVGQALLYLGSPGGLATSPSWTKSGEQAGAQFGLDVAGAGDINGDGYDDVIVGANRQGGSGAAYVYLGRPTTPQFPQGLGSTPFRTYTESRAGSSFGETVAGVGDVNRDGYADFAIADPTYIFEEENPPSSFQFGQVYVFHGSPTGPNQAASGFLLGEYPISGDTRFGSGVAGAGDVNGDGYSDVIVGDQWNTGPQGFAQGEAYLFHGGPTGLPPFPSRSVQSCTHGFCDFGRDVAGGGDINGDGFGDVLVGAYRFNDLVGADAGAVYVYLGNEGRGKPVNPRQSLGFGGAPLAILGATPNLFDASLALRSPAGRSRVTLELEVKPLGQDFNGTGLIESVMLDNVLSPTTALTHPVGNPNDLFHWRARLRSASPLFGRSRWISLPENGPRERDIRVVPEPGLALGMVVGAGFLALLARRRSRMKDQVPQ